MARVTPPTGIEGLFILTPPFEAKSTISYRVGAQRTFEQMIAEGDDPMKLVYTPAGLTTAEYEADKVAGAWIIVLISDSQKPIYVPDTYIESYPDMDIVPHSEVVLCVNLGILPDAYDLTRATQATQTAVEADTGIRATVTVATMPTVDAITQAAAAAAALARQAAITNRTTDQAKVVFLQEQVEALKVSEQALILLAEQLQARIDELEGSAPGS